jgi:hypothetical protein
MNPRVIRAQVISDHQVLVRFDNDEEKVFDVEPYLSYPVYQSLKEAAFFKRVECAYGTLVWPLDIDFCPDTVYLESKKSN